MTGVRFAAETLNAIERWAKVQDDQPTKAEAIRRLVELGLGLTVAQPIKPISEKSAARASALAGREIDRVTDPSAPAEERESRKRRLLKGPREFRDMRPPKAKD
jgi:hypothetical protein